MTFGEAELAAIAAAEEVEIETRSSAGEVHRTIIWPVVDDDRVLIRSFRGSAARWYREALADSAVAVHLDGRRLPATATRATDPASVAACSAGFRAKYRGSPSLRAMLAPDVLETTLRLEPA